VDDAALRAGLTAAAGALRAAAPARAGDVPLLYGPLLAALGPVTGDDPLALELIYEGYLVHYRRSRLLAGLSPKTGLLAGDHFYARGLRLVARRHDLAVVDLLSRLMAACSRLRAEAAPFGHDDDLWVVTVAAISALRAGGEAAPALALFRQVMAPGGVSTAAALPALARKRARELRLADARPLERFFAGETIGPEAWVDDEVDHVRAAGAA
jgi:hypothetical protein